MDDLIRSLIYLAIALLAVGMVHLGLQGFTSAGVPLRFGKRLRGTAGKVLGALLIAVGVVTVLPLVWLWPVLMWW
jgi:hypothetical protein